LAASSAQPVLVVLEHPEISPSVHLDKNLHNQFSENIQEKQVFNLD
jgi:hypothetical protein